MPPRFTCPARAHPASAPPPARGCQRHAPDIRRRPPRRRFPQISKMESLYCQFPGRLLRERSRRLAARGDACRLHSGAATDAAMSKLLVTLTTNAASGRGFNPVMAKLIVWWPRMFIFKSCMYLTTYIVTIVTYIYRDFESVMQELKNINP